MAINWNLGLSQVLITMWESFIESLPGLIAAIVLLVIGFIVGKIVGRIVREILVRVKVDEYVITARKATFKLSDLFSVIGRWWIYLIFIQAAAEATGIMTLTTIVGDIIGFIPKFVGGAIIVIAGYILAEYLKDRIIASKTLYGDIVGKAVFFLLIYVSIALALPVIGVDATIVNWILLVIVGSFGLGMAIALGLGLKDVVAATAKDYAVKFRRRKVRRRR